MMPDLVALAFEKHLIYNRTLGRIKKAINDFQILLITALIFHNDIKFLHANFLFQLRISSLDSSVFGLPLTVNLAPLQLV